MVKYHGNIVLWGVTQWNRDWSDILDVLYMYVYISLYIVYIFVSNSITPKVELRLVKPTSGIAEPVILKVIKTVKTLLPYTGLVLFGSGFSFVCSKGGFSDVSRFLLDFLEGVGVSAVWPKEQCCYWRCHKSRARLCLDYVDISRFIKSTVGLFHRVEKSACDRPF